MNIPQLSVFLENKPSRLQPVLKILADHAVNIKIFTIAEMNDYGVLRMIVDKPEQAHAALKANHFTCSLADVLAVALEDTPGALLRLIDAFSTRRQLNIEYMYAFTDRHGAHSIMIFRFEDIEAAKRALQEEGYTILKWLAPTPEANG
jgi:hypothetical protein